MGTILVVDDSPVSRRILSYTLERNGYGVIAVGNGQEALLVLHQQAVELVIADLSMPEMDGLTLLRHLRADERSRNVKVVMLTASGQEQDRIDAQAAGADDFLIKPISSSDLLATVRRVLA